MSQSSIHDYYAVVKKRTDDISKDNVNLKINNDKNNEIVNNESPFKIPITPAPKLKRSTIIKEREIKSESSNLKKHKSRLTSNLQSLDNLQTDNDESILKWTKRTINLNESCSETKKKRIEVCAHIGNQIEVRKKLFFNQDDNKNQNESIDELEQSSTTKTTIKKRLFDTGELSKIKEKIFNNDEAFLTKLKEFKAKTSSPIKLDLNSILNSPSKRLKDLEERKARARELIELSPKKFLKEKLSNSPIKSPAKIRSIVVDGLDLPSKYRILIDEFKCLDWVVSKLFNRMETCTFDKIKAGVQKYTKKNFDLSNLARLLTIYPQSYSLNYEKRNSVNNLNNLNLMDKNSPFHLVLTPVLAKNSTKLEPTPQRNRLNEFEKLLNQYARKLHNDFLNSLKPPVVIKDEELVRWHPSFNFPDIPEAKLPEKPVSLNETKSVNEFWLNKLKIEQPLAKPKNDQNVSINEQKKTKITKGILKGLSQEFLEKIKNKEAVNLAKEITRKPEIENKIKEIKRLPELLRMIHSVFTTEKKKAIQLSDVIKKCLDSSSSFSWGCCSDLIYLTNELLPDWLLILKTSQGSYVKINQATPLKTLYDRLDTCITKLKNS